MEGAEGHAAAAAAPAAAAGEPAARAGEDLAVAGPERAAGGREERARAAAAEEAEDDGDDSGDELLLGPGDGGPDLSQDAIADLRAEHKRLKAQQKRVRAEIKNKARKRNRVLNRMRHLDTVAVLQVLTERGVQFGPGGPVVPGGGRAAGERARPAAAGGAGPPAPAGPRG
jgi:hypothetical protein